MTDHDEIEEAVEEAIAEVRSGKFTLDLKSAALGGLMALALATLTLSIAKAAFPESDVINGIGVWFAGSLCNDSEEEDQAENKALENELTRYKSAWSCIEGGAAQTGIDISLCAGKLEEGE